MPSPRLLVKVASEPAEFEGILRLNHATFSEEITQHPAQPDGRLLDRFHASNTYVIALRNGELVGMLSVNDQRPFSLDGKLPNLDAHLPPHITACEVRLLAVHSAHRHGIVFRGLATGLWRLCCERGYDLGLISGAVSQRRLYEHLGFTAFGPVVGKGEALFQPMYLHRDDFAKRVIFEPSSASEP